MCCTIYSFSFRVIGSQTYSDFIYSFYLFQGLLQSLHPFDLLLLHQVHWFLIALFPSERYVHSFWKTRVNELLLWYTFLYVNALDSLISVMSSASFFLHLLNFYLILSPVGLKFYMILSPLFLYTWCSHYYINIKWNLFKSIIFWGVTTCSLLEFLQLFLLSASCWLPACLTLQLWR